MTKYVILGHGGFNPEVASYPVEILVGKDTTLQFFSEAGQALVLPTGQGDYTKVADMWSQVAAEGSPLKDKNVTYNYSLVPDDTEKERQSARAVDWGAGVVPYFLLKGKEYLCEGTAATCPTPALNVAESRHDELVAKGDAAMAAFKKWLADGKGELPDEIKDFQPRLVDVPDDYLQYVGDGVPEDRWSHHCTGTLGDIGGSGNELFWIACTSIMVATPEMPVLDTADASGPGAADVSKWTPDRDELDEIRTLNAKNLGTIAKGKPVSIAAGGKLVLIGPDHPRRPGDYLRRQDDLEEGQLTIGGAFGRLTITGIKAKQDLVRKEISAISDKTFTFA